MDSCLVFGIIVLAFEKRQECRNVHRQIQHRLVLPRWSMNASRFASLASIFPAARISLLPPPSRVPSSIRKAEITQTWAPSLLPVGIAIVKVWIVAVVSGRASKRVSAATLTITSIGIEKRVTRRRRRRYEISQVACVRACARSRGYPAFVRGNRTYKHRHFSRIIDAPAESSKVRAKRESKLLWRLQWISL